MNETEVTNSGDKNKIKAGIGQVWLFNGWVDILVGCGGWTIPLFLVIIAANNIQFAGVTLLFYTIGYFTNNPHYMATLHRAYARREDLKGFWWWNILLPVAVLILAVAAHLNHKVFLICYTLFLTWSPWHYTSQNFGLTLMFFKRAGYAPPPRERQMMQVAFAASYMAWFFSMHSAAQTDPYVLSLGVSPDLAFFFQVLGLCIFATLSVYSVWKGFAQTKMTLLLPAITLILSQSLWFAGPVAYQIFSGVGLPPASYSGGVLAFMHCTQYLWITSYFDRKDSVSRGETWQPARYFKLMFLGGTVLFLPLPWLMSKAFQYDLVKSYMIMLSLVNIHHFIVDGLVWKLRDKRNADLLVNETTITPKQGTSEPLFNKIPKLTLLVVSAFLIAVVVVDAIQYSISYGAPTLAKLELGAILNNNDSRIHLQKAILASNQQDYQTAIEECRMTLKLNPENATAQGMYGELLILQGKPKEALAYYESVLKRNPDSVISYIGAGFAAAAAGDLTVARDRLQEVVKRTPENIQARIKLADVFMELKQYFVAQSLYEKLLEEDRITDHSIWYHVMMNLTRAFTEQKEWAKSSHTINTVITQAKKDQEPVVYVEAVLFFAKIAQNTGSAGLTPSLFKEAINIAEQNKLPEQRAMAWAQYGEYISKQKGGEEGSYAAVLLALQSVNSGEGKTVLTQIQETKRKQLGKKAVEVETNLEKIRTELLKDSP